MYKLAAGVLVASITVAACGGSSGKPAANVGSGNGAVTSPSGSSNAFSDLIAKEKSADIKITYTDSNGKSTTIEQDGKGKSLWMSDSGLTISDGTSTIQCDGETSTARCTDVGTEGGTESAGLTTVFNTIYAGLSSLKLSDYGGNTSTQTIAGRDADCITFRASDFAGVLSSIAKNSDTSPNASETACVDHDTGFLLKLEGSDGEQTTQQLVATAASKSSPADFAPPSTPVTIPNITIPSVPGVSTPGYSG